MSDVSSAASGAPAASAAKVRGAASPASARPAPASGEKRGSCAPCRRAHQGCDGTRPCRRCISTHQEANCIDQVRVRFYSRAPRSPASAAGLLTATTTTCRAAAAAGAPGARRGRGAAVSQLPVRISHQPTLLLWPLPYVLCPHLYAH